MKAPKSAPTTKKTPSHRTGAGVAKKPRHHKRKPRLSDKLEGALLKVEGTLTGRRGVKAAGTKKLRGTDGKGERRSIRRSI
jgi:BRCT domain type II-containing protein